MLVNDLFRAIHDFFGHARNGNSFGPRGEFNAWREHSAILNAVIAGDEELAEILASRHVTSFGDYFLSVLDGRTSEEDAHKLG